MFLYKQKGVSKYLLEKGSTFQVLFFANSVAIWDFIQDLQFIMST